MAAEKIEESATGRGVKKKTMAVTMRRGQITLQCHPIRASTAV